MKRITKSSAFSLLAKARNEKNQNATTTQEDGPSGHAKDKTKLTKDPEPYYQEPTRKRKNSQTTVTKENNNSKSDGSVSKKKIRDERKWNRKKESKSSNEKRLQASPVVMDAKANVIKIPDEEESSASQSRTSKAASKRDSNNQEVVEIIDPPIQIDSDLSENEEANIIEISNDEVEFWNSKHGVSKAKKRKFKKEKISKNSRHSLKLSRVADGSTTQIAEARLTDEDRVSCLSAKDCCYLFIDHPGTLTIKGLAWIQCVSGSIQIMGYNLTENGQRQQLYSSDCNSYLTITTRKGKPDIKSLVESIQDSDNELKKKLEKIMKSMGLCAVIRVEWLESQMCDFISEYNPFRKLFRVTQESTLNRRLQHIGVAVYGADDCDVPALSIGEEIQSLLSQWNSKIAKHKKDVGSQPVMMICGGKGTGKSTTNRLLINTTLNSHEWVYVLDCDVGQAEFTPPGCVSLVKVTEPVLGPPFTHQRSPVCSYFFGFVTPADNPDSYIECVHKCVQYYRSLDQPAPLIVNTMGWIEDLGLQLLVDTVRLADPTFLVQLHGRQADQLPNPLAQETSWTDLSTKKIPLCSFSKERRFTKQLDIMSETTNRDPSKYFPKDLRNLTTLGYLSDNLERGLSVYSMSPYCIRWEDVAVHVSHKDIPQTQILYSLNAGLVALCEADLSQTVKPDDSGLSFFEGSPSFLCKGYGIVRGIDPVKKVFYVVTPLTTEELETVNTLVKGALPLPEQLQMDQEGERVPYVGGRISSFGEKALRQRQRPKVKK